MEADTMLKRPFWIGLAAAGLTLFAGPAWALSPPHDASNNIGCRDCHSLHPGTSPFAGLKPRYAQQEIMCKTCHNPTGMEEPSLYQLAMHEVDGGATTIDCGSCHSVHNPSTTTDPHTGGPPAPNLSLIRGGISKYVPQALNPAIFQTRPDHFTFATTPATGICQVCHTQTDYYTNDSNGSGHNTGLDCTTCHTHDAGFMPQGGSCLDCHNQEQGGIPRRQIVDAGGDFQRTSHHVQGTVDDSDCTVCHWLGNHQAGTVQLRDPDQGDALVYDYNSADPTSLGSFCVNCHDVDGAGGNTTPFSDGQTVPNKNQGGAWAASAHGDHFPSCYGDGTNGCHGNAHGSNLVKLLQPFDGSAGTDNVNQEEGFCYNCHSSGGVINEAVSNAWIGGTYRNYAADIESAFGMYSFHPVNDSAPGHNFDLGTGPQELECTSCHGVHSSTGKYWDALGGDTPVTLYNTAELWGDVPGEKIDQYDPFNTYQAPSIGEAGNDLTGLPLPIDAIDNSLLTADVLPDYNTMCLECHQHAVGSFIALDYPNQFHGSQAAEPAGATGFDLKTPYDTASRGIYYLSCMDCHEAHGSGNGWLIRQSSNGQVVAAQIRPGSSIEWNAICNHCHDSVAQVRHHNQDVYDKIGGLNCSTCHNPFPYVSCIKAGCHGHNDRF